MTWHDDICLNLDQLSVLQCISCVRECECTNTIPYQGGVRAAKDGKVERLGGIADQAERMDDKANQ
jgi:hypothetical protein